MTRKIIQIAAVPYGNTGRATENGNYYFNRPSLFALCNDKTLWRLILDSGRYEWMKLPPIPQDEE